MRTVIVTGATSGFGKGFVREFLRSGDRVVATGRNLTRRREILESERSEFGNRLIELDLDVTFADQRAALADFCRANFDGRVDVLVNNAGYGLFGSFENLSEEQMRAQFEVNVFGLALLTRELLPFLRAAKGAVFNVSSVLGFTGFTMTSLYCATKFAVEGLTESLAHELRPHGVRVCLVEPGSYNTGFTDHTQWGPLPAPGSPYSAQEKNFRRYRADLLKKKPLNPDPNEVPRGVVKLSRRRRLPLRAPFGKDSRSAYFAKRLLPLPVFMKILGNYFARTFDRAP